MKALQRCLLCMLCLLCLLFSTPLHAAQALVLTEIEQLQEKIWYLQKDVAAQKISIEKQQEQFNRLSAGKEKDQSAQQERLAALTRSVAAQQEAAARAENDLSNLKGTLTALADEVDQQHKTLLQQTEKTGPQAGMIQALQKELASSQARTEQALAEVRDQLAETRSQLEEMGKADGRNTELIVWCGAGAALLLAIALPIAAVLNNRKRQKPSHDLAPPTNHEL